MLDWNKPKHTLFYTNQNFYLGYGAFKKLQALP